MTASGSASEPPDWSDATRSLLRAPTLERIERHAEDLLSRAINSGRVIGFIGAGASMAYGRLSWRDLVRVNQDRVLAKAKEKADGDARIKALYDLLERHRVKADGSSKGDEFTQAFQLTEQLDALLTAEPGKPRRPGEPSSFRRLVAELVTDDRGHLYNILEKFLPTRNDTSKDDPVLKELSKLDEPRVEDIRPEDDLGRLVRRAAFLRGLCEDVENLKDPLYGGLPQAVQQFVPDGQLLTRPYHRFAIGLLMACLQPGTANERKFPQATHQAKCDEKKAGNAWQRAHLVPHERDPLRLLLDLRIGRFLTTNYDREIEKLLAAEGFAHLSDGEPDDLSADGRNDMLAPGSEDTVFDTAHTGHLFAFAAHTRRREAAVVHLHGRADRPEPLIATEEDYQRRYLADHDKRPLMDEAMRAAFTSSPLLFVGSGLGEDELVRPLRQFVHDPTIGAGRIAVALQPMRVPDSKMQGPEATAIRNLQRYGVHTIHYGRVGQQAGPGANWLGAFISHLDDLRKQFSAEKPFGEKDRNDLNADLSALRSSSVGDPPKTPGGKLYALCIAPAPQFLESIDSGLHPGLKIATELGLLKAIVDLLANQDFAKKDDQRRTLLHGFSLALTGIEDSVTGAFLCARLLRVHADWSRWRDDWLRLPEPEEPANAIEAWLPEGLCGKPFRRHHVHLPHAKDILDAASAMKDYRITPNGLPHYRRANRRLNQRFDARAYSPTFESLIGALECANEDGSLRAALRSKRRRIFLLVSKRGVGKGHFTTALAEKEYLDALKSELRSEAGTNQGNTQPFAPMPAAMFNLSFSHEISSTFDQLAEFLLTCGRNLDDIGFAATDRAAEDIKHDRLERLKVLLGGWGTSGTWPSDARAIVVFNRFGSLFDADGHAKNAQVAQVFDLLTGPTSEKAPIDLILVCSEHTIPQQFRRVNPSPLPGSAPMARVTFPKLEMKELRAPNTSKRKELELDRRCAGLNVPEAALTNPVTFVHFLRPARAIILATSYFPSVAMAIALNVLKTQGLSIDPGFLLDIFRPTTAVKLRMSVREALEEEEPADEEPSRVSLRESFPVLLAVAAKQAIAGNDWENLPRIVLNAKNLPGEPAKNALEKALEKIGDAAAFHDLFEPRGEIDGRSRDIIDEIDDEYRALFNACGQGRFAFTLLMACAYHYLLPIAEIKVLRDGDAVRINRAFQRCLDFLALMRRTLQGLPRSRRDDLLLERILDSYRAMHETPEFPLPEGLFATRQGMALFDLTQAILWHLAVIGQPVTTEVLVEIPAIRAFAARAAKPPLAQGPDARSRIRNAVIDALFLLEARCLVFEIHSSHLKPANETDDGQMRWAVHRLVQRHVFLTMRAPFVDYADTNFFAVTLMAAMPNDVPLLTPTTYRRLFGLVSALTAYPEPDTEQVEYSVWRANPNEAEQLRTQGQLLRAALGVFRAALSIWTLLRLDTREPDPAALPERYGTVQRGILDEHRLMLRWLLHQTDSLEKRVPKSLRDNHFVPRPLYSEEIVWLHNEIATVALLQGRMADAVAHYNRADDMAQKHLEPTDTAPLRLRIALNRANADIGRGRLRLAETALNRIIGMADQEHQVIGPIARGVLGLIQHIRGRRDDAESLYHAAVEGQDGAAGLRGLRRSRACAGVLRHHADLLRVRGELKEARQLLDQAYTLALEGNHEDVRHLIVLSGILVDLRDDERKQSFERLRREQHRKLDEADSYGRVMGIAMLQCEVAFLRTLLHMRDGDLKTAAAAAGKGLSLATVNDMQLRTTSFLLQLSEIYVQREDHDAARPMLHAAMRLARATEYHSAHQRGAELVARLAPLQRGSKAATMTAG